VIDRLLDEDLGAGLGMLGSYPGDPDVTLQDG